MRHTLEVKTVTEIKKAKSYRVYRLIRTRYVKAMEKLGYSADEARNCFYDVFDVAMLEKGA